MQLVSKDLHGGTDGEAEHTSSSETRGEPEAENSTGIGSFLLVLEIVVLSVCRTHDEDGRCKQTVCQAKDGDEEEEDPVWQSDTLDATTALSVCRSYIASQEERHEQDPGGSDAYDGLARANHETL